ncbi:MAG: substrate-binding domain-containing protein [Lachnospiraceae bacterium]|nr:substrate-binding domain-containing protein [Lachnospiraceae bacterium]
MKKCFSICLVMMLVLLIGCGKGSSEPVETTTQTVTEKEETTKEETTKEEETTAEKTTEEEPKIDASAIVMDKSQYPIVDGSTATLPLSYKVYELATGATPEVAEAEIIHTKTTNSYYRLANKEVDLLIVYEASAETLEEIKANGVELIIEPVGKDALVFMKNSDNPVESLTIDQYRDIYSGKITNWKEVGGEDLDIVAFQRPFGSGSQTLMESLIMQGTEMAEAPESRIISSMGAILEEVASYQNTADAIGYSVYYYANNMYEIPGLDFLGVNGVIPSTETIRTDEYELVNPFYVVIRADEPENSPARVIFNWLLGEDGQRLVEEEGYVPAK